MTEPSQTKKVGISNNISKEISKNKSLTKIDTLNSQEKSAFNTLIEQTQEKLETLGKQVSVKLSAPNPSLKDISTYLNDEIMAIRRGLLTELDKKKILVVNLDSLFRQILVESFKKSKVDEKIKTAQSMIKSSAEKVPSGNSNKTQAVMSFALAFLIADDVIPVLGQIDDVLIPLVIVGMILTDSSVSEKSMAVPDDSVANTIRHAEDDSEIPDYVFEYNIDDPSKTVKMPKDPKGWKRILDQMKKIGYRVVVAHQMTNNDGRTIRTAYQISTDVVDFFSTKGNGQITEKLVRLLSKPQTVNLAKDHLNGGPDGFRLVAVKIEEVIHILKVAPHAKPGGNYLQYIPKELHKYVK